MISCKNLHFKYRTKQIINDITLNFEKGHLYGVLGPNGSGKTTLLKLLIGLLKQNHGQVYIDDINLKKFSIRDIAKQVTMVNQTNYIEFDYKVSEVIKMGRYVYISRFSNESDEDKQIINDVIEQLKLTKLKDRKFNNLSGGEQQKVIIARAIAQKARILLLDEPISHLDINYQIEFMNLFRNYVKKGLIVILILHDLNIAAQYCDKIILMNNGTIMEFGNIQNVLTKNNIQKTYGIDVIIRKNNLTNSIYITPINDNHSLPKNEKSEKSNIKIHVICGGGHGSEILINLKHYDVSVGIINVLDDDYTLSNEMEFKLISEAPFSQISEYSKQKLEDILYKVDLIILANIPFGNENLINLKSLVNLNQKIIVFEKNPIEERDYTNGLATKIYNRLKKKDNVIVVNNLEDLIKNI
ncbi:MAG: ABC transporter ATP-binding protein [Candidatus Lokiarchaeota archaeon]|nr:ABC transporter ATP-binding protein [Candidatus Lokiarchaeota archaeon]